MKRGSIIGVIVLILVVVVVFFIFTADRKSVENAAISQDQGAIDEQNQDTEKLSLITKNSGEPEVHIIEIVSNGFSPKEINIKAGDTVTFINKDSASHWPASAQHPTHTVYPGSNIQKCGTVDEAEIFDSCRALEQDEEYNFIFTEIGEWGYHDHLRPSLWGKIIVE
jgi:plastocyanin